MFSVSAVCSAPQLSKISLYRDHFFKAPFTCWIFKLFPVWEIWLLWLFLHQALCEHVFPFLLNKYLGVKWLDHRVGVCLIIKEFSKVTVPSFSSAVYESSGSPICSWRLLLILPAFKMLSSNGYTVAVSVLLFSQVTKDVEHLFRYLLTVQGTFAKCPRRSFPVKKTACCSYCCVAIAIYIFWIQDLWQTYLF